MENNENIIDNNPQEDEAVVEPSEYEVIGVKFKDTGKMYYFSANNNIAKAGEHVIVETARGVEYGNVALSNQIVSASEIVQPLRPVIRVATHDDDLRYAHNLELQKEAFDICLKKIADHKLDMKLIEAEYTFDNNKLIFYFSSEDRVDFRELVKDLAAAFHTRIELRQIGIRDEAKMLGGFGICGRPFCCSSFLSDFVQVSIKMAKVQNLSLNTTKISGTCGRLMCCLKYENEAYESELKNLPSVDSIVTTPDGKGKVVEVSPLLHLIKVEIDDEKDGKIIRVYDSKELKHNSK